MRFLDFRVGNLTEPTILVRPVAHAEVERPWLFSGRDLLDLTSWDVRPLYSDAT